MGSIIPILRYDKGLLSKLSEKELSTCAAIREDNIGLVYRVLQGESICAIARDIPVLPKRRPLQDLADSPPDIDSGLFKNAVRTLEDSRD